MSPHLTLLFATAVVAFLVGACGSDAQALPAIPQSSVPDTEATIGESDIVTKVEDACLRSGGQTLVFVEGQADLVEVDSHEMLEVRSDEDGAGGLAVVPLGGVEVKPIGHALQPEGWSEQPGNDCEGPYFLVVGFEPPVG